MFTQVLYGRNHDIDHMTAREILSPYHFEIQIDEGLYAESLNIYRACVVGSTLDLVQS